MIDEDKKYKQKSKLESQAQKEAQESQKKQQEAVNKLKGVRDNAKDAVSEENILTSNAKRQSKLNDYAGQSSTYLSNAKIWDNEIVESQNRLKNLISNNGSLKEIEAEFNNLISATKEFNNSMSVVESTMEKSISIKSLEEAKQNIEDIKNSFKEVLSDTQLKSLNELQSKYVEGLTSSGKVPLDNQVAEIKERAKVLEEVANIRKESESGLFDVRSAKIDNTLSKYTGQSSEAIVKLRADAEAVKNAQKELTNSLNAENVDTDKVQANYAQLSSALEKYGNSLKVVKEIETTTLKDGEALNASNKVQTYINNNTKALKKYGTELNNIKEAYKGVQTVGEKNNLDAQFKNLKMKISAEGLSGMSRFDDIKRAFSQISQFAGIYGIAQNLIQDVPRQIISAVTEVNAAQIELTKVSDASGSQLSQYWDQAADSAKKYGATISDVISSTADWSKLGYGLDQAKTLSDATTLYQKVGDNMTQETASQSLVSTLQGFNMQADEAVSIVDKFNEVKIKAASIFSNKYALCV